MRKHGGVYQMVTEMSRAIERFSGLGSCGGRKSPPSANGEEVGHLRAGYSRALVPRDQDSRGLTNPSRSAQDLPMWLERGFISSCRSTYLSRSAFWRAIF